MPTRVENDVALLIDWENLKLSLRDHFGVSPNIDSLLDAANASGRVVLARAYADWTRSLSSVDAPNLYRAGIEPIYVPGREMDGRALKNSADVRMAVDAVDVCRRLPHVRTYVLVTGDGDLIHAVNFLQVDGKQVIVIGVRRSISDLLAATCDRLMFYERDVEPLVDDLVAGLAETKPAISPALETAFGWVKAIIAEPNDDRPYPFKRLRNELRLRHGLDTRLWFGVSFRHFMLRAERAGHVHLSTIGGLDYASLARTAPRLDAAALESPAPVATAAANAPEVRLESLTDEEQRSVIGFLKRLQDRSPYMVRKYIVDNLEYGSVVPRLSRDQLDRLVLTLAERQILVERRVAVTHPSTGDSLRAETLSLNESLPFVQERLTRADPFALLPAAVREARQLKGIGYFPLVQGVLERRLGGRLSEIGYQRLTAFFEEAEQRGIIRIAQLPNGADIVLLPDEEPPAAPAPVSTGSVIDEIGERGVSTVLRIVAAAEDRIGGRPVYLGSLIFAVRSTLPQIGGPDLGSSQVNRLLKDELRQAGYMRPVPLSLNREHPAVQAALQQGLIALPASIHIQPYGNSTATSATAPEPVSSETIEVTEEPRSLEPVDETPWPTQDELAADLAAGNKDVLFASLMALLKARAPEEYRFTDLGNDLRKQFGFQLKEHPQVASKFGDLIAQLAQRYPVETRKHNAHYFVRYAPSVETADVDDVTADADITTPSDQRDEVTPPEATAEVTVEPAVEPDTEPAVALEPEEVPAAPPDEIVADATPEFAPELAPEAAPEPEPQSDAEMAEMAEPVAEADTATTTEEPPATPRRRPRRRREPVAATTTEAPDAEPGADEATTAAPVDDVAAAAEMPTDEPRADEASGEQTAPTATEEPESASSAEGNEIDLAAISDAALAATLREVMAFENEQGGEPIDPTLWRRRFRQALERAGGPRLDAKSMTQLIRSRLLPSRLLESAGQASSSKKVRPYQVRRNHPNLIALLAREREPAADEEPATS